MARVFLLGVTLELFSRRAFNGKNITWTLSHLVLFCPAIIYKLTLIKESFVSLGLDSLWTRWKYKKIFA